MEIKQKFDSVDGSFETSTGRIVCVPNKKYSEVSLCFRENINIPFAKIKLHSENLAKDADEVFEDAVKLGMEIERRWHLSPNKL